MSIEIKYPLEVKVRRIPIGQTGDFDYIWSIVDGNGRVIIDYISEGSARTELGHDITEETVNLICHSLNAVEKVREACDNCINDNRGDLSGMGRHDMAQEIKDILDGREG